MMFCVDELCFMLQVEYLVYLACIYANLYTGLLGNEKGKT